MSPSSATGSLQVTVAIHFHGRWSLENGSVAKMNFRNILAVTLSSLTLTQKRLVTTLKALLLTQDFWGKKCYQVGLAEGISSLGS